MCPQVSNGTDLIPRKDRVGWGREAVLSNAHHEYIILGQLFLLLQIHLPQLFHHQESLLLFLLHGPHALNDSACRSVCIYYKTLTPFPVTYYERYNFQSELLISIR